MSMLMERKSLIESAQAIVQNAQTENRGLTADEKATVDQNLARIEEIDNHKKSAREVEIEEKMAAVGALFGPSGGSSRSDDSKGYLNLNFAQSVEAASTKARAKVGVGGIKGLMAAGDSVVEPVQVIESPVVMGTPASTIFDLVPTHKVPRHFSYLRQTVRDNQAAVVAPGELKPTSKYGLERIETTLKVVAHLSEPMHEYDLLDAPVLTQFLNNELRYGLFLALENELFNGTGDGSATATSLQGLNTTSGIQAQSFKVDAVRTIRSAITGIESQGYTPDGIFLNPKDWEAIETSEWLMNDSAATPVDRAARRLWSLPVAISNAVTPGSGWVKSRDCLEVDIDEVGVRLNWGISGDDFDRNLVRARLEGRFEVSVLAPLGISKVALA